MLNRRDMLRTSGAGALALGLSGFPFGAPARAQGGAKKRLLVFTRSQNFQHSVVAKRNGQPSLVDKVWTDLGAQHGFDVECTKDGRIFIPENIAKFDAFFFCTTGDLTAERGTDNTPPMPKDGKKALLDAIAAGKGFLGSHCASDTFHSPGDRNANQDPDKRDPYITMLGGEFISHGSQQPAKMRVVDPKFPGVVRLVSFQVHEEWYALKNFAPDLHVILAQDNTGMRDWQYQRADFPATWARMHDKGRVFYTSMGHREDVWENPIFQLMLLGAFSWATGQVEADIKPNLESATPKAMELPKPPPGRGRGGLS